MQEFLETIREKYSEDLGWRFTLFELLVFVIYLAALEILVFGDPSSIVLVELLSLQVTDLILMDDSLIANSKVGSILLALLATITTSWVYQRVTALSFKGLSRIRDLREYVERLLSKQSNLSNLRGANLMFAVNGVRKRRDHYMKSVSFLNGIGLVILSLLMVGISSFPQSIAVGLLVSIVFSLALVAIQWLVFSRYISKVIPLLLIENRLIGESESYESI